MIKKAELNVEGQNDPIMVAFNPAEYNLSNSIQYSEKNVPGLDGPIGQYISGASKTLNVTFMFYTYKPPTIENQEEGGTDVTHYTKQISNLTQIDGKLHRVPKVTFSWGSMNFVGVITDVKESYTMFLADGKPVKAKVDVTFKSVYDVATGKKPSPPESPDRTKVKTMIQGESLPGIAWEEYGSSEHWRVIAKENKILNPLDVNPGQVLKLPSL